VGELQPDQLLCYLPRYKVVICKHCQHALPPKGITRHLKERHRILRSARRAFLAWTIGLDLAKPENVRGPQTPEEFPVSSLPVYDGLRCVHGSCRHLCLTEKRMRDHWSRTHLATESSVAYIGVQVQTFFSGNLLRYFTASNDLDICPRYPVSSSEAKISGFEPTLDALVQHYRSSTSHTIAAAFHDELLWRDKVIWIAQAQPFLMLGIFSIASLHLSTLLPNQQREWTRRANEYQDEALPLFRAAIAAPSPDNCDAIFLFSHLLILNEFATDHLDQPLLLVCQSGEEGMAVPRWLHFMRSGCSMLCDVWDVVERGPCRQLVLGWDAAFHVNESYKAAVAARLFRITSLPLVIEPWAEKVSNIYKDAAAELAVAFALSEACSEQFNTMDALRIWPMRISEEFFQLLTEQHPASLVLLAQYCVLLRRIESEWYFQGRATKMLQSVREKLLSLDVQWDFFTKIGEGGL
jgi:hypothetical protein